MTNHFTTEAQELWDQLSDEEQKLWIENGTCQKCSASIPKDGYNGSVFEGQLALFHECEECGNKEVRLIDVTLQNQKSIDDDFAQWVKAKEAQNPDRFK